MKNLKTLILAAMIMGGMQVAAAQGISFERGSWATVLKKAKTSDKIIFVDFYATWCKPCSMMTKNVFTDARVGEYFNKHFVSWTVDAEKEEEDLVNSVDLEVYPTLVFFDQHGKMLYKHLGTLDADALLFIGGKVASFKTNRQKALNGTATKEETLHYLSIAKLADPENYKHIAQKLVNELTAEDLKKDYDAWNVLLTNVSDINHPAFEHVVEAGHELSCIYEEEYFEYINDVLDDQFNAALRSGNLKDLDTYKKYYQVLYKNLKNKEYDYRYFDLNINANYYRYRNELDNYTQTMTEWVESYVLDDWETLTKSALQLSNEEVTQPYKEKAIQWALRALSLNRNKHTLYNLARVYANNGKKEDAIQYAKQVLELELVEEEYTLVENFIRNLEN